MSVTFEYNGLLSEIDIEFSVYSLMTFKTLTNNGATLVILSKDIPFSIMSSVCINILSSFSISVLSVIL